MNNGRIAASQDIVEVVTRDNFNLVWATIDWSIRAGRFRLSPECVREFRQLPHEPKANDASLPLLNDWMGHALQPETRRRIFADIRRAQFEAAKGAVQITIAEETQKLLRDRKTALFGANRGSMEVTIRHLLEAEQRALPWQAFRLLEAFRQRHALSGLSDAVRILIDYAELAYQAHEAEKDAQEAAAAAPPARSEPPATAIPTTMSTQAGTTRMAGWVEDRPHPSDLPLDLLNPVEPVWNALAAGCLEVAASVLQEWSTVSALGGGFAPGPHQEGDAPPEPATAKSGD